MQCVHGAKEGVVSEDIETRFQRIKRANYPPWAWERNLDYAWLLDYEVQLMHRLGRIP